MYQLHWQKKIIRNPANIIAYLNSKEDLVVTSDTETTGLNLRYDNPFVISFALRDNDKGFAFAYDIEAHTKEETEQLIEALYNATRNGLLVGHNLIYDLNMLGNVHTLIPHNNIMDTMTMIRLSHDAVQEELGGPPLSLKDYARKYIDKNAANDQKILSSEATAIAKGFNIQLAHALKDKKETLKFLDTLPNDADDLPEPNRTIYKNWLNNLPEKVRINMTKNTVRGEDIPYTMLNRAQLLKYAAQDVILTYEIYLQCLPIIEVREQMNIYEQEKKLMRPLLDMTRVGFRINKPYVTEAKLMMKDYLNERIKDLKDLAGVSITQNQNAEILNLLKTKFNCPDLQSTAEDVLNELAYNLEQQGGNEQAVEFISTVLELRTLSKWYKTYLIRFSKQPPQYTHLYTSLNPAGTVTGRFTSDFQQFPKSAIKKKDGTELFDPRKMVLAEPGTYLFYADYSQIELRIQAMYTLLIGEPDTNLCRAYMPYKCINYLTKEVFQADEAFIKRWDEKQEDGKTSAWLMEDGNPWIPTDLHAATTHNIFPDIPMDSPEFKKLRSEYGKRTNFACNYGAKPKKIHQMYPRISWEEAVKIYEAYTKTFPGVVAYQKWCYTLYNTQGYGINLYGRRYYGSNGHNGANAHIQGTGADLLKEKIIDLHEFLKPYKTRMQMNIHDEISFVMPPEETHLIPTIKHIMEDVQGTLVPIVAELEISETTWAEKKGFKYVPGNNPDIIYK